MDEILNLPTRRVLVERLDQIKTEAKRLRILIRTGDQLDKIDTPKSKVEAANAAK